MKDPLFYRAVRGPLAGIFSLIYRPTIIGKENIPKEGRILLAGNHTHILDCFLVGTSTKRCVHFVAKAELMKGIWKPLFKGMGIVPVNRSSTGSGKAAMETAEKYLESGKLIAIFPEGTVNRTDDIMMPFKGGAVKIANDSDTKIVPFAIMGKYKPFKKSVTIKFMPAIEVQDGKLKAANNMLSDMVRNELIKAGEKR